MTYYSLRRTDVNLKAKPDANGALPQYPAGTLLVAMLDPGEPSASWCSRTDKPVDLGSAMAESVIKSAITELFAKYPTLQK